MPDQNDMDEARKLANEARLIGATKVSASKIIQWAEDNGERIAALLDALASAYAEITGLRSDLAEGRGAYEGIARENDGLRAALSAARAEGRREMREAAEMVAIKMLKEADKSRDPVGKRFSHITAGAILQAIRALPDQPDTSPGDGKGG